MTVDNGWSIEGLARSYAKALIGLRRSFGKATSMHEAGVYVRAMGSIWEEVDSVSLRLGGLRFSDLVTAELREEVRDVDG